MIKGNGAHVTTLCAVEPMACPTASSVPTANKQDRAMLKWAAIFFIIAIVAAIFGFGGIAATAAGIAKVLFFIFLVIFVIFLVMGLVAGRRVL